MKFIIDLNTQAETADVLKLNNLSGELKLKFELSNGTTQAIDQTLPEKGVDNNPADKLAELAGAASAAADLEALANQTAPAEESASATLENLANNEPDPNEYAEPDDQTDPENQYQDEDPEWEKTEVSDTLERLSNEQN